MAGDEREELLAIVRGAAAHARWLADAGVDDVPHLARAAAPTAGAEGAEVAHRPTPAEPPLRSSRAAQAACLALGEEPALERAPRSPTRPPSAPASLLPPPASATLPFAGAAPPRRSLEEIRAELGDCTRCKLSRQGRTQIVFGQGNPRAELMFVGEGPGEEEDKQGLAFVGKAGQLLTKMIEAMGYTRDQVYIANTVKCRPPGNRNPEPDEIAACEPFLKMQIASVQPKVIVTLGKFAAHTLLRVDTPITRLRGQWCVYEGTRLMPTFHPAYLLRNPGEKGKVWEDLKLVMKELGKKPPAKKEES